MLLETDLSGNLTREFIYFAGQRIARRDASGTVYYYFSDALGTNRVMTTDRGYVEQESTYYPFGGEQRVITNTVDNRYKFAGMYRNSEGNQLDHTLFRKYASNYGRWLSPDPIAGIVMNPQSLNRYSYVLNSPVDFSDPLGLFGRCKYSGKYPNCAPPPQSDEAKPHIRVGPELGTDQPPPAVSGARPPKQKPPSKQRTQSFQSCVNSAIAEIIGRESIKAIADWIIPFPTSTRSAGFLMFGLGNALSAGAIVEPGTPAEKVLLFVGGQEIALPGAVLIEKGTQERLAIMNTDITNAIASCASKP